MDAALAAPAWPANARANPGLARCLVLAMLLHLLVVLLVGTAPGGTARPGEGVWGRLNVTLRDVGSGTPGGSSGAAPAAAPRPEPRPHEANGPRGTARQERFGGAVREPRAMPETTPEPGAARLGAWGETPADTTAPAAAPDPMPALATPAPPEPEAAPRLPAPAMRPPPAPLTLAPADLAPAALPPTAPALPPMPAIQAAQPAPEPPAAAPAPAVATPVASPAPSVAPPRAGTAAPAAAPASPAPGLARTGGAPDAGSRLGHDVATPASVPPSAPARLNLDYVRPRGGELAAQPSRGVLQLMPAPPERKSKLAEGIERAAKSDCRTAYSGMGLAAVVPLALDAARDKGCKW